MAGIAAPLLAGFSLTLVGVITSNAQNYRWPGAAITFLVIPAALLVACIQFGFRARSYLYSSADTQAWRPDFYAKFSDVLRREQAGAIRQWNTWERRAGWSYNLAICILALGVALTVAPPAGAAQPGFRWAGSGVAVAAALGEAAWIGSRRARAWVSLGLRAAAALAGPSRARSPWEMR